MPLVYKSKDTESLSIKSLPVNELVQFLGFDDDPKPWQIECIYFSFSDPGSDLF